MRTAITNIGKARLIYGISGYSLILIGLLLLSAAGGYWIYAQVSKARLGDQNVSVPLQQPEFPTTFERIDQAKLAASGIPQQPQDESGWRVPSLDEYRPVDWAALPRTVGVLPPATRIIIPSIDISSSLVELSTVWEDGKLVWERPVNVVGHHDGTPNPGESGNIVMSGHRSSPILGEGAVFKQLGDVPGLLKESSTSEEPVDIFLYTAEAIYVYRAVSTQVVEPGQVNVFRPTAEPTLTLITCTPDLIYSHRLILTAWLVATAPL